MITPKDITYMRRALTLAKKAMGCTSPNPMVGAVLVKGDQVLGKVYHQCCGGAHAEIIALGGLSRQKTSGATLYVNLEPCCHYGKTPPCLGPILKSGVSRVVIGIIDPNPQVNGRSIRQFKEHGVSIELGVMEKECRELNRGYLKYITTGIPWVTVKIAQTIDGKIADSQGSSRWITGASSRKVVHQLRAGHDAVLVGSGTVLKDNPQLTVRQVRGRQPQRIVLDANLDTPPDAVIFDGTGSSPPWIITGKSPNPKRKDALESVGAKILSVQEKDKPFRWEHILKILGKNGITSVLVEGGGSVFTGILKEGAADRIIINIAPKLLGSDALSAAGDLGINSLDGANNFRLIRQKRVGEDLWVELEPVQL